MEIRIQSISMYHPTLNDPISTIHLKKRYWGQHLWARGYFGVTVGNVNSEEVQRYIENQEEHHRDDNFSISEF